MNIRGTLGQFGHLDATVAMKRVEDLLSSELPPMPGRRSR